MAAAAELLESTAAVDLLAATLPLPDEPLHASNGDRKCLGRFCCGTNTHGVWSEFGSFVPTEAGIAAGLSQLDSGDPVTWTSRADEGLGSGTSGRLLSFFVGKQVGTSSCHERYAAVVANTATGPKLDLVTLMGRGSECRVARGSELSSSDLHSVDTSTAQVAALRDEMRSKLRPLSVKAMKQKRHYVNTEAAKRKALRSSEAPTPRRRRCSSANDPPLVNAAITSDNAPVTAGLCLAPESSTRFSTAAGCTLHQLQSRIQELSAEALRLGAIITMCPIQARQGRASLNIRSYGMVCNECGQHGVWDANHASSLVGCMDCATAIHASCIGVGEPREEWRCQECYLEYTLEAPSFF